MGASFEVCDGWARSARDLPQGLLLGCLLSAALACAGQGDSEGSRDPGAEGDEAQAARGTNPNLRSLVVDDTRCVSAGKRVSQVDLNHDDFADLITVYVSENGAERVGCKQADLNFDGRLDAFYYYDDAGAIDREQFDLDFDGRIDLGRYYEGDLVIKDEQDLDLDGAVDTWRFYDKGRVVRMETDRDADGRPDMFTYYVREEIDRIGYDVNGDGKADQWDHDAARRAKLAIDKRKEAQAPPPEEGDDEEDVVAEPGDGGEGASAGTDEAKAPQRPGEADATADGN